MDEKIVRDAKERLPRLDLNDELREKLLPYCRLKRGDIWEDELSGHRVGVLDASSEEDLKKLMGSEAVSLVVNDPPYNLKVGKSATKSLFKLSIEEYIDFSRSWVSNVAKHLQDDAHFYVWLGADQNDGLQPLPDFMIMMRDFDVFKARSFITLRNQRGYGSQKNWMWARQELLYYVKGNPDFKVTYTDIPKVLKGYYKTVKGKLTENLERGRSDTIRPGNVWIDVQQVFYRMEENVPGCYAQKPLKAIERIIESSSKEGEIVLDCFSHSGCTLVAGEKSDRKVFTCDLDPVFAEITIRRLERYRKTKKTGWQWQNPFPEIDIVR